MDRRRLPVLAVVVALALSGCWTTFRGSAARTGSQPFEFSVDRTRVSTLGPAWTAVSASQSASPVVAGGHVYASTATGVSAFDAAGTQGCAGSPVVCTPQFTATGLSRFGAPAVDGGVLYVVQEGGTLAAFDANGGTNCTGSPASCTPLWQASVGVAGSSPVVADGVVSVGGGNGLLATFSTAGPSGCSGSPVVCAPLWTATVPGGGFVNSSPAIAEGVEYVGTASGVLAAYDAQGRTDCSGMPRVCAPLWTATLDGQINGAPAVANGTVYVTTGAGTLAALDAAGQAGCSGVPRVCAPLWTAAAHAVAGYGPAVDGGHVFVAGTAVTAFDATPGATCSGSPVVCQPLWSATVNATGAPTVAGGVVYVPAGAVVAFDESGGDANCSGTPRVCRPLWVGHAGGGVAGEVAVVGGTVYAEAKTDRLYAFRPCAASPYGLTPCDLRNAYQLPSLSGGLGGGVPIKVAVVEAAHDPYAEADLNVYRAAFGLPPCTTANGCFKQVNQSGQTGSYPPSDPGWSVETSLDLDMVSAVCPNCDILLVEAPNTIADINQAEDTASAAKVVSNSFGTNEISGLKVYDSHFVHTGVATVVSTGDNGYAAGPQWPAVIPKVVAVGGTTLVHTGTGRGWSDTVWSVSASVAGGSGCSVFETKPAWQTDTGCAQRTTADVAAAANAVAVYDSYGQSGWITVGGTSASAPIVAGAIALGVVPRTVSDVYANAADFYDVTGGSNGTCSPAYLCTAGTGFDGPTGIGVPCGIHGLGIVSAPGLGCTAPASVAPSGAALRAAGSPTLPSAPTPQVPACRAAPPGGVRCFAFVRSRS